MDKIRERISRNQKVSTVDIKYLMGCFKEHVEQTTRQINSEEEAQKILNSTLSLFFKEKGMPIQELGQGDGFLDILLILINKDILSKILIELKIYYSPSYFKKGFSRLKEYMKNQRLNSSFYLVFYNRTKALKDTTKIFGNKKVYVYFIKVQNKFENRMQRIIKIRCNEWIEHNRDSNYLVLIPELMDWFVNRKNLKFTKEEGSFIVNSAIKNTFTFFHYNKNTSLSWLDEFDISAKLCIKEIEEKIEGINPYERFSPFGDIEVIFTFLHSLRNFAPKTYNLLMKLKIKNSKKFLKKIEIYLSEGDVDFEYRRKVFDIMRNFSFLRLISQVKNLNCIKIRDKKCKLLWKILSNSNKHIVLSASEVKILPKAIELFYDKSGDVLLKTADSEDLVEKIVVFLVDRNYFKYVVKESEEYTKFLLLYSKKQYSKSFFHFNNLMGDGRDYDLLRILESLNMGIKPLEKYSLKNFSKIRNPEISYDLALHFYHKDLYEKSIRFINQTLRNKDKFKYSFSIAHTYRLKAEALFLSNRRRDAKKIIGFIKRKKWKEYLPNLEKLKPNSYHL